MIDKDQKEMLPVHLVLGTNEYARMKTEAAPKIGREGEPIAEKTKFGLTLMYPGKEFNLSEILQTQTSTADYEGLCRLDVLGLENSPTGDQTSIYDEFQEQLTRSREGWYETSLPNNESGSLRRLNSLVKKLEKSNLLDQYDKVIKDQLDEGIVERVQAPAEGRDFYIPHKPVIRESTESTKLRVAYDASARANHKSPSLNECLNPGPPYTKSPMECVG